LRNRSSTEQRGPEDKREAEARKIETRSDDFSRVFGCFFVSLHDLCL
jgi:hypothetical protein